MNELTSEDRATIENEIVEYKKAKEIATQKEPQPIAVLKTPDGQDAEEVLNDAIREQSTPDKKEKKHINKKIRGIWHKWRVTALNAKSLEVEKIACQIAIERAETQQKLDKIRREEEIADAKHWLELNQGNLKEIDANTESKPSKFWYNARRGCHHITKLSSNVPKVFKNLLWVGLFIIGLVLLKQFNVL